MSRRSSSRRGASAVVAGSWCAGNAIPATPDGSTRKSAMAGGSGVYRRDGPYRFAATTHARRAITLTSTRSSHRPARGLGIRQSQSPSRFPYTLDAIRTCCQRVWARREPQRHQCGKRLSGLQRSAAVPGLPRRAGPAHHPLSKDRRPTWMGGNGRTPARGRKKSATGVASSGQATHDLLVAAEMRGVVGMSRPSSLCRGGGGQRQGSSRAIRSLCRYRSLRAERAIAESRSNRLKLR